MQVFVVIDEGSCESLIGVFSTREKAEDAVRAVRAESDDDNEFKILDSVLDHLRMNGHHYLVTFANDGSGDVSSAVKLDGYHSSTTVCRGFNEVVVPDLEAKSIVEAIAKAQSAYFEEKQKQAEKRKPRKSASRTNPLDVTGALRCDDRPPSDVQP